MPLIKDTDNDFRTKVSFDFQPLLIPSVGIVNRTGFFGHNARQVPSFCCFKKIHTCIEGLAHTDPAA